MGPHTFPLVACGPPDHADEPGQARFDLTLRDQDIGQHDGRLDVIGIGRQPAAQRGHVDRGHPLEEFDPG